MSTHNIMFLWRTNENYLSIKLGSKYDLLDTPPQFEMQTDLLK